MTEWSDYSYLSDCEWSEWLWVVWVTMSGLSDCEWSEQLWVTEWSDYSHLSDCEWSEWLSGLSGLTTLMQMRKSDIEQIQCNVFQVHVLSSVENRVSKGHHVHTLRNFQNSMHCVLMHDISITLTCFVLNFHIAYLFCTTSIINIRNLQKCVIPYITSVIYVFPVLFQHNYFLNLHFNICFTDHSMEECTVREIQSVQNV